MGSTQSKNSSELTSKNSSESAVRKSSLSKSASALIWPCRLLQQQPCSGDPNCFNVLLGDLLPPCPRGPQLAPQSTLLPPAHIGSSALLASNAQLRTPCLHAPSAGLPTCLLKHKSFSTHTLTTRLYSHCRASWFQCIGWCAQACCGASSACF